MPPCSLGVTSLHKRKGEQENSGNPCHICRYLQLLSLRTPIIFTDCEPSWLLLCPTSQEEHTLALLTSEPKSTLGLFNHLHALDPGSTAVQHTHALDISANTVANVSVPLSLLWLFMSVSPEPWPCMCPHLGHYLHHCSECAHTCVPGASVVLRAAELNPQHHGCSRNLCRQLAQVPQILQLLCVHLHALPTTKDLFGP